MDKHGLRTAYRLLSVLESSELRPVNGNEINSNNSFLQSNKSNGKFRHLLTAFCIKLTELYVFSHYKLYDYYAVNYMGGKFFYLREQSFKMSKMLKLPTPPKPSTTLTLNSEAKNIIKLPGFDVLRRKSATLSKRFEIW